ncbi:MAG: hypothetical protein KIS80_06450 [Anaerolineales bacterium]|nr:hypothetical protein [Anaerolineales bacterium]
MMHPLDQVALSEHILSFDGVEMTEAMGYKFFFYKDERLLAFATLALTDNPYEQVSNLSRPGVFRLNIGLTRATFEALFGSHQLDLSAYDFAALDRIMPHPDYAAQSFVCVLNPAVTWGKVQELLAEAYQQAVRRYLRKEASSG